MAQVFYRYRISNGTITALSVIQFPVDSDFGQVQLDDSNTPLVALQLQPPYLYRWTGSFIETNSDANISQETLQDDLLDNVQESAPVLALTPRKHISVSTSSLQITGSTRTLSFTDLILKNSDDFTVLSATQLRVEQAADFELEYKTTIENRNNSRSTTQAWISINGSQQTPTLGYGYHRTNNNGIGEPHNKLYPISLSPGDIIEVRCRRFSGGGNLFTRQTYFKAQRADSNVAQLPPVITSGTPLMTVTEGIAYSYQASTSGSAVTWALSNAPSGMTINSVTGLLQWDNPVVGSYNSIRIDVSNTNGTSNLLFNLEVEQLPISTDDLLVWLLAEDITSLVNARVPIWNARQGVVAAVANTNASQQPILRDANGFSAIQLASNSLLFSSFSTITLLATETIFIVFSHTDNNNDRSIYQTLGSSGAQSTLFINARQDGDVAYSNNGAAGGSSTSQATGNQLFGGYNDGNIHLMIARQSGSETFIEDEDGNVVSYLGAGGVSINTLRVGDSNNLAGMQGFIYEIVHKTVNLNTTERNSIKNYLKNKYGI